MWRQPGRQHLAGSGRVQANDDLNCSSISTCRPATMRLLAFAQLTTTISSRSGSSVILCPCAREVGCDAVLALIVLIAVASDCPEVIENSLPGSSPFGRAPPHPAMDVAPERLPASCTLPGGV